MSNEPNQAKGPTVEEVSHRILKVLEESGVEDPDVMRRAIGLTLTSVHTAMIAAARTDESQREAVLSALDSIDRIAHSVQDTIEREGIKGIKIERAELNQTEEKH